MTLSHAVIALLGGFVAAGGLRTAFAQHGDPSVIELASEPIELRISGRAMSLRVVRDARAPERVIDQTALLWSRVSDPVRRDRSGPWVNLSRVVEDRIEVLQLRKTVAGGSEGYLVSWGGPVPADTRVRLEELLPEGFRTVLDVGPSASASGRSLVARGTLSIDELDRALATRASVLGLRRQQRGMGGDPDPDPAIERTRFFSGTGETAIALTLHARADGGTAIVIHLMEPDR
jgi:hypothetical protein